MRGLVVLGLPFIFACAAGSTGAMVAEAPDVEVELPAPREADESVVSKPVERASFVRGIYSLQLNTTESHGCSRGGSTMTVNANATIEIEGKRAWLKMQAETSTRSWSRGTHPSDSWDSKTATVYEGVVIEPKPGDLRIVMNRTSCEGECVAEKIDVVCQAQSIPLDDRERHQAKRGEAGEVRGLVCTGIPAIASVGDPKNKLPFGQDKAIEVTSFGRQFSDASAKWYAARPPAELATTVP